MDLRWRGPAGEVLHELRLRTAPAAAAGGEAALLIELDGRQSRCQAHWRRQTGHDLAAGDSAGTLQAHIDGRVHMAQVVRHAGSWHVFADGRHDLFTPRAAGAAAETEAPSEGGVLAPMPGKVIALLVSPGSAVVRDAPLLIVEAMKMEHTVRAPRAGVLQVFHVQVGDQVAMGEQLMDFAATVAVP